MTCLVVLRGFFAGCMWPPTPAGAGTPSLTISSPVPGAVVGTTLTVAVETTQVPTVTRVEYALGSYRLGIATSAPYALSWHTGYASDGDYDVIVPARDALGTILATADQLFSIPNHGNALHVCSTPDLSQTLRGRIVLSLTACSTEEWETQVEAFLADVRRHQAGET